MDPPPLESETGVLLSGGLDSSILLGHLLEQGRRVRPLYVQSCLVWEREELHAVRRFLQAVACPRLGELVVLSQSTHELYGDHWSTTGRGAPDLESADEAVFLPGRNLLLITKAAVWCQLHGINRLTLGVLGSNPFPDATAEFFVALESALSLSAACPFQILRPLSAWTKRQVMERGRTLPLELTFSCISPVGGRHCGRCNKCAERQRAFRGAGMTDPTCYATSASVRS